MSAADNVPARGPSHDGSRAGTTRVINASALELPLPDASVDLIITSPPYFALRSYRDGDEHYDGQIGSEATPQDFLESLWAATREMVRVLKPTGSIWVNLGDKYAGSGGHNNNNLKSNASSTLTGSRKKIEASAERMKAAFRNAPDRYNQNTGGIPAKSLMGLPWRYAIGCIDQLGLILRAEVVWSKPNGLPESVTDRVRRSHEQWFWLQKGSVVDSAEILPGAPVVGSPTYALDPAGVPRCHECMGRVVPFDLPHHVRTHDVVQGEGPGGPDQHGHVPPVVAGVPFGVVGDVEVVEDSSQLLEDGDAAAVDHDPKMRSAGASVREGNGPFAVDQPGEPSDLCRCSHATYHSTWFHFTKQGRYFAAVDEVREPHAPASLERYKAPFSADSTNGGKGALNSRPDYSGVLSANPLGKLPGSVWTIPSEPLRIPEAVQRHYNLPDHFAAFPTEWPRRIILGWSPTGICTVCGEGRRPVSASSSLDTNRPQARRALERAAEAGLTDEHIAAVRSLGTGDVGRAAATQSGTGKNTAEVQRLAEEAKKVLGGYSREFLLTRPSSFSYCCACPDAAAPTRPAVVLDPFGGTGTVAMVARALGRVGISVDLSADYCRLAEWRIFQSGHGAKAEDRTWADRQASLFDVTPAALADVPVGDAL